MLLKNLDKYRIILGSKSPRRRELLHMIRVPFESVVLTGIKEEYPADMDPEEVPLYLSNLKANAYLERFDKNVLIITADTLVICEGQIMGKPRDEDDAVRMLMSLSDKKHHVVTGVTLATHRQRTEFTVCTDVKFAKITEEEARYYVNNFSPLDKAGAYGIQEWIGGVAVESIDGSFYNVMGLPIHRLYQELKNF